MSVNNTVASTRSSATSACWPVRNSATCWKDSRQGSTKWYALRPGSSTYFAPDMWSATYLPLAAAKNRSSACWMTKVGSANRREHRPYVEKGHHRQHKSQGPGARRESFMPRERGAHLVVPRHIRIQNMLQLPSPPHAGDTSSLILGRDSVRTFSHRIRVTLEHDQRGCAGRMCRCKKRRRGERTVDRNEDCFATLEIVQHCGNAVGPLLQCRQRGPPDGIGRSRARLVEKDQSAY